MAKPRQSTDDMLHAGMNVLYSKGYNGTGMQDIASAADMTKGAIYGYFKSKEDFAVKAIEMYTSDLSYFLKTVLLDGEDKPLDRLKALWSDWSRNQFTKYNGCGCFAGNMSQEMANHSPAISKASARSFNALESVYKNCLDQAVTVGQLRKNTNTVILAGFIYNGWQGALVRAKAEQDNTHLISYVDYIFTHVLK